MFSLGLHIRGPKAPKDLVCVVVSADFAVDLITMSLPAN